MSSAKTSTTAFAVVCGLTKLAKMPRWKSYFSEEMIRLNEAFVRYGRDTPIKHAVSWLSPGLAIRLMDSVFIPGMVQHFLFRKRLIESQTTTALLDGAQQVLVLGGGFDTLIIRMANQYPSTQFFEIDLPHTQRIKIEILEHIRYPIAPNCTFVPADLAQASLASILHKEKKFNPDIATWVILEGVLMYLTEPEVRALFSAMYDLFLGPLRVVFGATVASDDEGPWQLRMTNNFLEKRQEVTKWYCPSQAMPKFMADMGYALREWMPYKMLQRFYRDEPEIQRIPEEDENYYTVTKMPRTETNVPILAIERAPFIPIKS